MKKRILRSVVHTYKKRGSNAAKRSGQIKKFKKVLAHYLT